MILNEFGTIINAFWKKQETTVVKPQEYVVMPNHFHGIIEIISTIEENREINDKQKKLERRKMILPKFVGKFKMQTAKEINRVRNKKGTPLWQKNYHEHVIRDDNDYYNIINYIQKNPENWGKDKYY